MRISFLASHGGSSAKAIISAIRDGELPAETGILICNNRAAPILHWCLDNAVEFRHISAKTHRGEDNADEAMASVLQDAGTDLLVCSGYMKKIGPRVLDSFSGRILNIHPALLPDFGGQGMYGDHVHAAVLAAGRKESGASVHYVTDEYDAGPVIRQVRVPVYPDDSLATLRARVQAAEPGLYLAALQELLQDNKQ